MTDSTIVYQARLHWIIFFWPLVLLFASMFVGLEYKPLHEPSAYVAIFAMIWLLTTWVTYLFSSLTIKKNQVILRTGVLIRQTIDIPVTKIECIDIRQTILGGLFRYGSLVITGTGGSRQSINYINQPLTCRRYIEQLMHNQE